MNLALWGSGLQSVGALFYFLTRLAPGPTRRGIQSLGAISQRDAHGRVDRDRVARILPFYLGFTLVLGTLSILAFREAWFRERDDQLRLIWLVGAALTSVGYLTYGVVEARRRKGRWARLRRFGAFAVTCWFAALFWPCSAIVLGAWALNGASRSPDRAVDLLAGTIGLGAVLQFLDILRNA